MEETTLLGASWYNQKYYFNEAFAGLPKDVQDELHILAVEFTEDVGGVFTIFSVRSAEGDQRFDEIGAELLIKKYQREKADLMSRLAVFYRIRILKWDAARALEGLDIDLEGPDEA